MNRRNPIKLGEFFYLVPENQSMQILLPGGLAVEGEQDALSCVINKETNNLLVSNVEAMEDKLLVWLELNEMEDTTDEPT